jgi:hypothetical protein
MDIQTIIFDRDRWSKGHAIKYLIRNNFAPKECIETICSFRYVIRDPSEYKKIFVKKILGNITLLIGERTKFS